ncbi:GPI ethanolamine phosphate transferase 3 [Sparassis crispa]|uniref:GPI ethanolamine phosphate transferase 3 n=1 Tax=Sparassis crispa TaxID=139825 RepID=A0A401GNU5_9APHY|nr:GPI ethanolamine phosphate transferase 3 [Sparassis crispa]GBE83895.1 GPI ethanolamine phosphate transferase 3 [Sparassis crispa]
MSFKGLSLLTWVFVVHLAAIYLYTRGFLLTRLSLSDTSSCPDGSCTLPPTHSRAVVLIIDALRFDFLSPDPPQPPSPHHHNVLRLPQELTAADPSRSLLFDAFADPPTTTLQRIKGLTTGSLPTFVDMGSNFGGASILEDSLIAQLRAADKKVAFMGDDTWTAVFPDAFAPGLCFPYDSFNVEDLHTVDAGVERHMLPLLADRSAPWDVLIGHFLGVDHVGHRVGPDHPTMHAKLAQMDAVLRRVVELLDEDTLLVVLGDHGMDRRGDHGGDGVLETSSALWVYSKGFPLTDPSALIPAEFLPRQTFPGAPAAHRVVQQIDLVPSLALLLGLPIPFNNLGTVIPELFWRDGTDFARAAAINAKQVKRYLDTYRASPSGGELDAVWAELESKWAAVANAGEMDALSAMKSYTREALAACRMLWAQFNVLLIVLGLVLLVVGTLAGFALFAKFGVLEDNWEDWAGKTRWWCVRGMAVGTILGFGASFPLQRLVKGVDALDCVLFGAPLVSCLIVIIMSRPKPSGFSLASLPLPLILHTLAFASNSFTVWEDRIITFLLLSCLVPFVRVGFTAPTGRLRNRILGFSAMFAVCVRLMAGSTVCREEQQPYCHVTFFASSTLPSPPLPVLLLLLPAAVALPWCMRRFLQISKSDKGIAGIVLPVIFPAVLAQGSAYWILEWLDSAEVLGPGFADILRLARTMLARSAMGTIVVLGLVLCWFIPLCLEISTNVDTSKPEGKREVTVVGFANAFGAPYLVFWCASFGLVYVVTQPTGQLVLCLAALAVLAYLEVVDSVHDVRALSAALASTQPSAVLTLGGVPRQAPSFAELTPLALLALHTFYRTGHQSVIASIQWKTAFVLTPTLTYPLSPLLVILNTFGPQFLLALSVPLVALWNVAPLPQPAASARVSGAAVRAGLGVMLYHATLLLGSAASSAWLRRHLMVWKVFAPRFMNAAATILAVDLAVLFGVGVGVARVAARVTKLFKGVPGSK